MGNILFELIYLIAMIRGIFPDNHKGNLVYGSPNKKIVKEMYKHGYIPYRVDYLVAYK